MCFFLNSIYILVGAHLVRAHTQLSLVFQYHPFTSCFFVRISPFPRVKSGRSILSRFNTFLWGALLFEPSTFGFFIELWGAKEIQSEDGCWLRKLQSICIPTIWIHNTFLYNRFFWFLSNWRFSNNTPIFSHSDMTMNWAWKRYMFWSSNEGRLWAPDSPKSQALVKHVVCCYRVYRTPSVGERCSYLTSIFLMWAVRHHEKSRHRSKLYNYHHRHCSDLASRNWAMKFGNFMIQGCIMESDLPVNKVEFSILPV